MLVLKDRNFQTFKNAKYALLLQKRKFPIIESDYSTL